MSKELLISADTWGEAASLLGQPVEEVLLALLPGETIEGFLNKNGADILEAEEFRKVLKAIAGTGKICTVYYPGAGADLIPDEIWSDEFSIPVFKTSSPSEFDEFNLMFPEKYRETYFPAEFGETRLPINKAELIILRNVPDLPELYGDVEKYLKQGTLIVVFETPFKNWCKKQGFERVTQRYFSGLNSGIEVFKII